MLSALGPRRSGQEKPRAAGRRDCHAAAVPPTIPPGGLTPAADGAAACGGACSRRDPRSAAQAAPDNADPYGSPFQPADRVPGSRRSRAAGRPCRCGREDRCRAASRASLRRGRTRPRVRPSAGSRQQSRIARPRDGAGSCRANRRPRRCARPTRRKSRPARAPDQRHNPCRSSALYERKSPSWDHVGKSIRARASGTADRSAWGPASDRPGSSSVPGRERSHALSSESRPSSLSAELGVDFGDIDNVRRPPLCAEAGRALARPRHGLVATNGATKTRRPSPGHPRIVIEFAFVPAATFAEPWPARMRDSQATSTSGASRRAVRSIWTASAITPGRPRALVSYDA